jgi:SCY1-like protein 1
LATSELQSTISAPIPDRPTSALAVNHSSSPAFNPSASTPSNTIGKGRPKGMQLGGSKAVNSTAGWALEAAAEADSGETVNPWGNDDLMDVNADQDDWSGFYLLFVHLSVCFNSIRCL